MLLLLLPSARGAATLVVSAAGVRVFTAYNNPTESPQYARHWIKPPLVRFPANTTQFSAYVTPLLKVWNGFE